MLEIRASTNLDRFEGAVQNFEQLDKQKPISPGGTVFIGSSTFTKWTGLEKQFSEFRAINRGFGGSTIPEVDHYLDRVLFKYKPANVVLYAGTNDIADGRSGRQVFDEFVQFVRDVKEHLPNVEIYVISMSVAPSRISYEKEFDTGNGLIRHYVMTNAHLHYIDVTPVMHRTDGKLKENLFGIDRLHMNSRGYALWVPVIQKLCEDRRGLSSPTVLRVRTSVRDAIFLLA